MEKHYCQCGCGQEVGIWGFTSRTYGFVKGQPKQYITGHNSKRKKKLREQNKYVFQDGLDFAERVRGQVKKVGEFVPVNVYWAVKSDSESKTAVVPGKIVGVYENFYLVDMGKYVTTQRKVDVALMGGWMC